MRRVQWVCVCEREFVSPQLKILQSSSCLAGSQQCDVRAYFFLGCFKVMESSLAGLCLGKTLNQMSQTSIAPLSVCAYGGWSGTQGNATQKWFEPWVNGVRESVSFFYSYRDTHTSSGHTHKRQKIWSMDTHNHTNKPPLAFWCQSHPNPSSFLPVPLCFL